jgi:uncharacterized protein (TIGR02246 family)
MLERIELLRNCGLRIAARTVGIVSLALLPVAVFGEAVEDVAASTEAWASAYNSHDPDQVLARYSDDAVFWGTTSATLRDTPADIVAYFSSLNNRPNARVTIGEHRVRVHGDVAINTGYYTFTDIVDGAAVTRPSRFSFVYHLVDGQWLIIDHHSSRLPMP